MPPSSSRARTTSRDSIWLTGKCLPMSRRKSSAVRCSVQSRLLTRMAPVEPGVKSRNRFTSARIRSTHPATVSGVFSTRSADEPDWPVPGLLEPPHCQQQDQIADVQPRSGGVEPAVERDDPGVERLSQVVQVGRYGDQTAPAQLV